ncbi:MAG: FAD-dependent oxidoreductase, partial [Armatimonadetes bacterium]|nr:FAD-dependent oxidoreductase [Armatimonadota bacterium]NIM66774.1 FAD-dependent oxidoreductase [Armatimonadota bacterium]NIT30302.1 FAD-dependent oxidoreductase [Armatimonadota bacterium]
MKRDLAKLANREYDLLVIGGGIYGACVAWDAALRGLSVALVEKGDFGGATSSNSLKIVHGGLRYLQDANLKLVRTMVRERSAFMQIAPHLVQPL